MTTMTPLALFQMLTLLFKTAYYGLRLIGQNDEEKLKTKQDWGKMVVGVMGFEVTVEGEPLDKEHYILVGNHISFLDIPVLLSVFPQGAFIAKSEIRKWPVIGPAAAAAGTMFVDRTTGKNSRALRDQIDQAMHHKNKKIVIFPSGTTTLYEERPWKKGIFKIAQEKNISVKVFTLTYQPMRESAYVNQDNLLRQIAGLSRIKNKKVCLRWLAHFDHIDNPEAFAEELRQVVKQDLNI